MHWINWLIVVVYVLWVVVDGIRKSKDTDTVSAGLGLPLVARVEADCRREGGATVPAFLPVPGLNRVPDHGIGRAGYVHTIRHLSHYDL